MAVARRRRRGLDDWCTQLTLIRKPLVLTKDGSRYRDSERVTVNNKLQALLGGSLLSYCIQIFGVTSTRALA